MHEKTQSKSSTEKKEGTLVEQNSQNITPSETKGQYDLVVFSHLRWDFVYQRPQHIISRMSNFYKILFVEEPIPYTAEQKDKARITKVSKQLSIFQPMVDSITDTGKILKEYISNTSIPIAWFYSAAFVQVLNEFKFDRIVYDCMDELSLFKGASEQIRVQERYLMSEADVVFTGGKSLYEAKSKIHSNVYCFPSSVDRLHFEKALNGIEIPPDMALTKPIIGYYGVIDERIDLELLDKSATIPPEASFVMIGPVVKIDPNDLPRHSNIHYLGMKSYAMLPHYLKGFDIAMMPFALNDSTKFISPTKTLEYMAAKKPIISTPIYDVVRDYSHCVSVVNNADEFCREIKKTMRATDKDIKRQAQNFENILNETSWDKTVQQMHKIVSLIAQPNGNI